MSPHLRPSSRPTVQCCPNSPFFENAQSLTSTPQPNEIYRTLRALPPLKALGLDGYHTFFFQSNWPSLGLSIIQVIQEVFKQLTSNGSNPILPRLSILAKLGLCPGVERVTILSLSKKSFGHLNPGRVVMVTWL